MSAILHETPYGTYLFPHEGTLVAFPRFYSQADRYGFEIADTGGGCTALFRDFELADGTLVTMVATDTGGLSHAIEPGEPVMLGVYPRGETSSEALTCWIQTDDFGPPSDISGTVAEGSTRC
jgi:hypothetical protein